MEAITTKQASDLSSKWDAIFVDDRPIPTETDVPAHYGVFLENASSVLRSTATVEDYRKLVNVIAFKIVANNMVDAFEISNAKLASSPGGTKLVLRGIKALIVLAETTNVTSFEDLFQGQTSWPIEQDDWERFQSALRHYNALRSEIELRPVADTDILRGLDKSRV